MWITFQPVLEALENGCWVTFMANISSFQTQRWPWRPCPGLWETPSWWTSCYFRQIIQNPFLGSSPECSQLENTWSSLWWQLCGLGRTCKACGALSTSISTGIKLVYWLSLDCWMLVSFSNEDFFHSKSFELILGFSIPDSSCWHMNSKHRPGSSLNFDVVNQLFSIVVWETLFRYSVSYARIRIQMSICIMQYYAAYIHLHMYCIHNRLAKSIKYILMFHQFLTLCLLCCCTWFGGWHCASCCKGLRSSQEDAPSEFSAIQ